MADNSKFAGVNSITFHQRFKTEADCQEYLSLLKWGKDIAVKDVLMPPIVQAKDLSTDDVQNADTMKAPQQEQCLTR